MSVPPPPQIDLRRYHRQTLLPQIGETGQLRLAASRALLVGCGALGTTIADQLVRAGVGHLTVVDRDVVELTNLQRQTLFDERDAAGGTPKAIAAADRLRQVNSAVEIVPVVADVHAGNVEAFTRDEFDVVLDGTDNVRTRYLVNDACVMHAVPWVYGAAVGVEGRVMAIRPGQTACLRCVFPTPPAPDDLATCDTTGVLGMAASIVAAYQAIEAVNVLTGHPANGALMRLDFWPPRTRVIRTERDPQCPCCGRRWFEYLNAPPADDAAATLCGRNAIQVRATGRTELSLDRLADRLRSAGQVRRTPYFVKCELSDPTGITLTIFPDGRALIQGVTDPSRARSLYARFVGA
jgi:adenylyltransferase/sulfurtransferase